jgi:hypothetical protein
MSGAWRFRPVTSLQPQQPAPGGVGNGFRTASDVHLGEDRFPVRLDRAFARPGREDPGSLPESSTARSRSRE